jgi:hypothetical protein
VTFDLWKRIQGTVNFDFFFPHWLIASEKVKEKCKEGNSNWGISFREQESEAKIQEMKQHSNIEAKAALKELEASIFMDIKNNKIG